MESPTRRSRRTGSAVGAHPLAAKVTLQPLVHDAYDGLATMAAPRSLIGEPYEEFTVAVDSNGELSIPLGPIELSGSYAVPAQRVTDFLARRVSDGAMATSYPLGASAVDLHQEIVVNPHADQTVDLVVAAHRVQRLAVREGKKASS